MEGADGPHVVAEGFHAHAYLLHLIAKIYILRFIPQEKGEGGIKRFFFGKMDAGKRDKEDGNEGKYLERKNLS